MVASRGRRRGSHLRRAWAVPPARIAWAVPRRREATGRAGVDWGRGCGFKVDCVGVGAGVDWPEIEKIGDREEEEGEIERKKF